MGWEADAMTIQFAHSKTDQAGKDDGYKRHIYANPDIHEICPITWVARYRMTLTQGGTIVDHLRSPLIRGLPMSFILQPWQLLLMVLASWVHREQQKIIEFYQAQLERRDESTGEETAAAHR